MNRSLILMRKNINVVLNQSASVLSDYCVSLLSLHNGHSSRSVCRTYNDIRDMTNETDFTDNFCITSQRIFKFIFVQNVWIPKICLLQISWHERYAVMSHVSCAKICCNLVQLNYKKTKFPGILVQEWVISLRSQCVNPSDGPTMPHWLVLLGH